jgi:hypothetical protein
VSGNDFDYGGMPLVAKVYTAVAMLAIWLRTATVTAASAPVGSGQVSAPAKSVAILPRTTNAFSTYSA